MKSSIGRIVHYIEGDFENQYEDSKNLGAGNHPGTNGTRVHPAIITRVWSDHCVNLHVFKDAKHGGPDVRTSVTMIETPEETHNPNAGWRWPPRVEHLPCPPARALRRCEASMTVDLSPIINAALGVTAIAITVLGTWVAKRLAILIGIKADDAAIQAFDDALARAVRAGAGSANELIAARGWDHPDVKSAIVATAAPYVIAKFAPALKSVGLDPADPGGATTAYVTDELNRIFPTAIAAVAASPVTPPTTGASP